MSETYTEWRLEDHITSGERARGVLEAAVEKDPGDGSLIRDVLSAIARSQNMSALARDAGLNRAGLYKAPSEDGNPSFTTVMKITRALGLRLRLEPVERR